MQRFPPWRALVDQMNLDAIVEKRELAHTFCEYVIVIFDVAENLLAGKKMNFGAAPLCFASHRQRRNRNTHAELDLMNQTIPANGKPQPFRQSIDHGYADAMQSARYLVGIVVEFAAGMKFGHDDLGGGALQFVILLDPRGNAAPIVLDGYGIIGMDNDA